MRYVILFLLLLPSCLAITAQTSDGGKVDYAFYSGGAGNGVSYAIEPYANNEVKGFFYTIQKRANQIFNIVIYNGNTKKGISTDTFDITINLEKNSYHPGDTIKLHTEILNKQTFGDSSFSYQTYILSPDKIVYEGTTKENIYIKQACEVGAYDSVEDSCIWYGAKKQPFRYIIEDSITLPKNVFTSNGWRYIIKVEANAFPSTKLYDTFNLGDDYFMWIVLAIVGLLIYLNMTKKKPNNKEGRFN